MPGPADQGKCPLKNQSRYSLRPDAGVESGGGKAVGDITVAEGIAGAVGSKASGGGVTTRVAGRWDAC